VVKGTLGVGVSGAVLATHDSSIWSCRMERVISASNILNDVSMCSKISLRISRGMLSAILVIVENCESMISVALFRGDIEGGTFRCVQRLTTTSLQCVGVNRQLLEFTQR